MPVGPAAQGPSAEEILAALGDHAKRVHKVEFDETLKQKAKDRIRFYET